MADEIIRMEDIYADDIVGNINEVREARGTFESLDARLDNIGGGNAPSPSTSDPAMDGTASPGSADTYSRGDHVHPTDTSRQAVIDSAHKLSSDLVDDTNNTHKFATAAQLEQIKTNKNNISYNTDNGVKNTFDFANAPEEARFYTTVSKTSTSLTVTANNPGGGSSSVVYSGKNYPAGDYIFSCKITDYSCTTETAKIYIATSTTAGTGIANKTLTGNGTIQIPFHWNGGKVYIKYFPNESNTVNQSNTFTASENMIMLASISDTTYQPYAISNAELTALSEEDRAALVELVDGGAKNIASANTLSASIGGVTCTQDANDKNIISLAGTNTSPITTYIWGSSSSPLNITVNEDYYIAAAERSTNISFAMSYVDLGGTTQFVTISSTGYVIPTGCTIRSIYVQQNATNKTIDFSVKLMICSKVAWDISHAYQPYRPSYQELYERVVSLEQANQ